MLIDFEIVEFDALTTHLACFRESRNFGYSGLKFRRPQASQFPLNISRLQLFVDLDSSKREFGVLIFNVGILSISIAA